MDYRNVYVAKYYSLRIRNVFFALSGYSKEVKLAKEMKCLYSENFRTLDKKAEGSITRKIKVTPHAHESEN